MHFRRTTLIAELAASLALPAAVHAQAAND